MQSTLHERKLHYTNLLILFDEAYEIFNVSPEIASNQTTLDILCARQG